MNSMVKKHKHDPNSVEYNTALLEDMNHKFDILIEAVQPIPELQENARKTQTDIETMKGDIWGMKQILKEMQPKLDVTYEAVGSLFVQVEEIKNELSLVKKALTLLGRDTSEIENLKKRVTQLEEQVKA